MSLLALCVFVSVVGESFREDEGRGFGEDFSFTCRDDRSGSTESFRSGPSRLSGRRCGRRRYPCVQCHGRRSSWLRGTVGPKREKSVELKEF